MPRIETLPVELFLNILQYLPLQSLCSIRQVSQSLNDTVCKNESTVYHHAALLHNYVPSIRMALSDVKRARPDYQVGSADGWKDFCRQCFTLDRNWVGLGSVTTRTYCAAHHDVHRIKVDELRGLLITSHGEGGIRVTDTITGTVVWSLPSTYVRAHAHLEYENGFLIFDRLNDRKEVWRIISDIESLDVSAVSPPDDAQLEASREAEKNYADSSHGHFKPWALLVQPEPTRAFRFAYPTLAVMAFDTAFLWDVPSGELAQIVRDVQGTHGGSTPPGTIVYVDVSAKYVFVCGWLGLRVFNRSDGALVLSIPANDHFCAETRIALDVHTGYEAERVVPLKSKILQPQNTVQSLRWPAFVAVHVSRNGRDLVMMLNDNRLLLLQDFERVVNGQVALGDAVLEVDLTVPERITWHDDIHLSVYLAFEHGRVSVATTSGLYILTLDATQHRLLDPDISADRVNTSMGLVREHATIPQQASFPYLAACYVPHLCYRAALNVVSCLQMTATKVYLTWDWHFLPHNSKMVAPATDDLADDWQPDAALEDAGDVSEDTRTWGSWPSEPEHSAHMWSGGHDESHVMEDAAGPSGNAEHTPAYGIEDITYVDYPDDDDDLEEGEDEFGMDEDDDFIENDLGLDGFGLSAEDRFAHDFTEGSVVYCIDFSPTTPVYN